MYIDTHVHLRDFKQQHKETIKHGLEVALDSGVDAVLDMPNTDPAITTEEVVLDRLRVAKEADVPQVFYGVYRGLTPDPEQVKKAAELATKNKQVVGLKLYAGHSVGNLGIVEPAEQERIYAILAREGYRGVLVVHAEKEGCMSHQLWTPNNPVSHCYARPNTPEGQQMAKHPELLLELIKYMRTKTDRVIGIKLSPDMSNEQLRKFAEMVMPFGKTYVNVGNTTYRKCIDVDLPADAISIGGGGLSGPALYERTLGMAKVVAPTGIAICATGGIDSAEKVRAVQKVGREYDVPVIVGMATAVVKDMYCIPIINRALGKKLRKI
ncbi:MAG: amidohydrolase family protein [Candidatus Woesearchaeota archaeon]|nr:amidohydrolase family protein [Candidatus Woesearchaeota archaeon]